MLLLLLSPLYCIGDDDDGVSQWRRLLVTVFVAAGETAAHMMVVWRMWLDVHRMCVISNGGGGAYPSVVQAKILCEWFFHSLLHSKVFRRMKNEWKEKLGFILSSAELCR